MSDIAGASTFGSNKHDAYNGAKTKLEVAGGACKPSMITSVSASAPADSNQCRACNKRVYEMEKLVADGQAFHKTCFKCCKCARTLRVGNYASMDSQIFCKPHFIECFKQKGNYEEGFGRERHKNKWLKAEGEHDTEKENIPLQTNGATSSCDLSHLDTNGNCSVADSNASQSISNLSGEFSLSVEDKKSKLMQAAHESSKVKESKLLQPAPGKLKMQLESSRSSSGQHSRSSVCEESSDDQLQHDETGCGIEVISPTNLLKVRGVCARVQRAASVRQETEEGGVSVRQKLLDFQQQQQQEVRPRRGSPSGIGQRAANIGGVAEQETKAATFSAESTEGQLSKPPLAAAAAAAIARGSLRKKMLELEQSKEAAASSAEAQKQLRLEADAQIALAVSGSSVAMEGGDRSQLHFAEVAAVTTRFESGELKSVVGHQQTAAREEVEQVRSVMSHRTASMRMRFQKIAERRRSSGSSSGMSPAKSMPNLVPCDEAVSFDDIDDSSHVKAFGDEALPDTNTAATLMDIVPRPGQLKSILSKFQSVQDLAVKSEKLRPRPKQIHDFDRIEEQKANEDSTDGSGMSVGANDALPAQLTDAKFKEEPWTKKAKSLREKFESYEQHNKAMGMRVSYVVESRKADIPEAAKRKELTVNADNE